MDAPRDEQGRCKRQADTHNSHAGTTGEGEREACLPPNPGLDGAPEQAQRPELPISKSFSVQQPERRASEKFIEIELDADVQDGGPEFDNIGVAEAYAIPRSLRRRIKDRFVRW